MNDLADMWLDRLSPIHQTIETFNNGGMACGMIISRFYEDLLATQHYYDKLQDDLDNKDFKIQELEEEIRQLMAEIIELKKTSEPMVEKAA